MVVYPVLRQSSAFGLRNSHGTHHQPLFKAKKIVYLEKKGEAGIGIIEIPIPAP